MRYERDKWSNWGCHVARMNCYASVYCEFENFSSNFSLAWLWFICNLLTSTNNRLLLQLRRWRAPVLELVAVMMAMVITYHHHRRRLLRSSLLSSWGAKGQWKKLCASLRRRPLMATHSNQGPSQISTVYSRNFWIQSLLSSRWLRNHYRLTSAQYHWAEVSSTKGHRASESWVCFSSAARTSKDLVDTFPIIFAC